MSWSFLQQNATLGAGVASQATAFPGNVQAGSLIVVAIHVNGTGTTIASVTDTRGTTYAPVGAGMTTLAGLGGARLYWGITPSAGACTVTVTPSVSDTVYVGVFEYQGIAQGAPFDVQAAATGSSATPASGNATTGADNELAVGFCFASGTAAAGTGWTSRSTFNGDCFEDRNVTPPGAVSAAFTMSPTGSWIALEATFAQQLVASYTPRPLLMPLTRFMKAGPPVIGFAAHQDPVVGAVVSVAAAVSGSSAVAATVVRDRAVTAAATGSSAVTATVVRTRTLIAVAAGSSSVAAAVARTRALAAAAAGSSAAAATVVRDRARAASAAGASAVTASVVRIRTLVASAAGSSAVTAALSRTRTLASSAAGATTVDAAVVRDRTLAAVVSGSAEVTSATVRDRAEAAAAAGSTAVSATIVRMRALTAAAAGSSSVEATVATAGSIAAAAAGSTTVAAALTRDRALTAEAAGGTVVTGAVQAGDVAPPPAAGGLGSVFVVRQRPAVRPTPPPVARDVLVAAEARGRATVTASLRTERDVAGDLLEADFAELLADVEAFLLQEPVLA